MAQTNGALQWVEDNPFKTTGLVLLAGTGATILIKRQRRIKLEAQLGTPVVADADLIYEILHKGFSNPIANFVGDIPILGTLFNLSGGKKIDAIDLPILIDIIKRNNYTKLADVFRQLHGKSLSSEFKKRFDANQYAQVLIAIKDTAALPAENASKVFEAYKKIVAKKSNNTYQDNPFAKGYTVKATNDIAGNNMFIGDLVRAKKGSSADKIKAGTKVGTATGRMAKYANGVWVEFIRNDKPAWMLMDTSYITFAPKK